MRQNKIVSRGMMLLALASAAIVPTVGSSATSATIKVPPIACTIETAGKTFTPDELTALQAEAKKYEQVARDNYAMIYKILGAERNYQPKRFDIVITSDYDGVAATGGDKTEVSTNWALKQPQDLGMIVHELAHVVQHYGDQKVGDTPGWLVEGIADYVRWFNFEPKSKRPHPNPKRAKATDAYQTSATFLYWATNKYDKNLVKKLNQLLYDGDYTPEAWKTITGKTLDELNTEWVASLQAS